MVFGMSSRTVRNLNKYSTYQCVRLHGSLVKTLNEVKDCNNNKNLPVLYVSSELMKGNANLSSPFAYHCRVLEIS